MLVHGIYRKNRKFIIKPSIVYYERGNNYHQARSQGGAGVRRTTPNLPKGPLFGTNLAKNGVLRGRFGPKGPLSGVPHPIKIEPGYGPATYNVIVFFLLLGSAVFACILLLLIMLVHPLRPCHCKNGVHPLRVKFILTRI